MDQLGLGLAIAKISQRNKIIVYFSLPEIDTRYLLPFYSAILDLGSIPKVALCYKIESELQLSYLGCRKFRRWLRVLLLSESVHFKKLS